MARNRKRTNRRGRRPPTSGPQPGLAATSDEVGEDGAPDPLEHAAPDADIADAHLTLGRHQLSPGLGPDLEEDEYEELEEEEDDAAEPPVDSARRDREPPARGRAVERSGASVSEPRALPGNRLVNFLQGSWRELQRVQWPDRRQVMQATGVVIGFVIVAAVFLGVADTLAGKLMDFILK